MIFLCKPNPGGGPKGEGWGPEGSSPATKFVLFFPLWGFSRGILVVFEAPGRSNVRVWSSLVVVCEPRRFDATSPVHCSCTMSSASASINKLRVWNRFVLCAASLGVIASCLISTSCVLAVPINSPSLGAIAAQYAFILNDHVVHRALPSCSPEYTFDFVESFVSTRLKPARTSVCAVAGVVLPVLSTVGSPHCPKESFVQSHAPVRQYPSHNRRSERKLRFHARHV